MKGEAFSCNLDCYAIAIESPWLEWIPPPSYYSSLLDVKRDFEEKVVLYILAVLLSTAKRVGIPVEELANILWRYDRELYYFIEKHDFEDPSSK